MYLVCLRCTELTNDAGSNVIESVGFRFDGMCCMTSAGHMRDVQGTWNSWAVFPGGLARYCPIEAYIGGGPPSRSYASELARQKRFFQRLERIAAQSQSEPQQLGVSLAIAYRSHHPYGWMWSYNAS